MPIARPMFIEEVRLDFPVGTNDRAILLHPRQRPGRSCGLIWCHGATSPPGGATDIFGFTALAEGLARFAACGLTVLCADFGDYTVASGPTSGPANWGTSTATARIEAWRQWLVTQGVAASKVIVAGYSMGTYTSMAYCRDFPSKVAACAAWNPAMDLVTIQTNPGGNSNWPALKTSIDGAWGLASTDPIPAQADLYTNTAIQGVPWWCFYSDNDPIVPNDWGTRLGTWIGPSATVTDVGGVGHFAPTTMPTWHDRVVSFFYDHLIGVT